MTFKCMKMNYTVELHIDWLSLNSRNKINSEKILTFPTNVDA